MVSSRGLAISDEEMQELDHNLEGLINPFERTLGRLDIDRDLTDRQQEQAHSQVTGYT